MQFDTRARILELAIQSDWDPSIKAQWETAKQSIQEALLNDYGVARSAQKLQNFLDLGAAPFSIIAYHNRFLAQVRTAFVCGAYYPALTGACALGERILNHLILALRASFRSTPEYRKVYRKESFDNWALAIEVLEAWSVLAPEVPRLLRDLADTRNRSLHFNPELDSDDRSSALSAVKALSEIVERQFGSFGTHPWFIPNVAGTSFIAKDWEDRPFIREVYVPCCAYVSPFHQLEHTPSGWRVLEPSDVPDREISDSEFAELYAANHGGATPTASA